MLRTWNGPQSQKYDDLSRGCEGGEDGDGEKVVAMIGSKDTTHLSIEAEANPSEILGGTALTTITKSSSLPQQGEDTTAPSCSSGPEGCEAKINNSHLSSDLDVLNDASSTPLSIKQDKKEDVTDKSDEECQSSLLMLDSGKGGFKLNNMLEMLKVKCSSGSLSVNSDDSNQIRTKRSPRIFMKALGRRFSRNSSSVKSMESEDAIAISRACTEPPGSSCSTADDLAEAPAQRKGDRDGVGFQALQFIKNPLSWRSSEGKKMAKSTSDVGGKQESVSVTISMDEGGVEGDEEKTRDVTSPKFSPEGLSSPAYFRCLTDVLAEPLVEEASINEVLGSLSIPEFKDDVEHLWGNESHRWKPEARHQLETWSEPCAFNPYLMFNSITRCLHGRREQGWLKEMGVRDIVDALVTRTFQLLPGRDKQGRRMLITTLNSLDYKRCPQEQYDKCLSYLLQDAADIHGAAFRSHDTSQACLSCEQLVLIIDLKKEDFTWAKVKSLVDFILGVNYEEGVSGKCTTINGWSTTTGHPFCDPLLSYFPLVLSSVVVVNAGPKAKVAMTSRRCFRNSNYYVVYPSSKGRRNSEKSEKDPSTHEQSSTQLEERVQPYQLPISIVTSKAGWAKVIGDEGLSALPVGLSGNMPNWSIEMELNYRIRMDDVPQDHLFRSDMLRFLHVGFELSHTPSRELYVNCLTRACQTSITVPVMWVRQSLGDLEEAALAEAAPWKGRHGQGVRQDLVQLQKDVARDEILIDGVPNIEGDVIDALFCRIKTVAEEGGLKIPHVQCHLAARDILLSTKRTTTGGDTWTCIDKLCHNRNLVVICPVSKDADALQISANFVPGDVVPSLNMDSTSRTGRPNRRPSSFTSAKFCGTNLENEMSSSCNAVLVGFSGSKSVPRRRQCPCVNSGKNLLQRRDRTEEINEEMLKTQIKKGEDMTGGFVAVTARTKMIFKICATEPLDGCALVTLSCMYYRYFSVGPEGLKEGAVPSNVSPLVIISSDSLNDCSPTNGI